MVLKGCIVLLITFVAYSTQEIRPDACLARQAPRIPKWHIYHRLCKPLIIGHRGNPIYYQENTLEGFRSVHKFGGNAIELDVYLTKDGKLVLFHDKNALRTTGVNRNIQDMTSQEVKNLRYSKDIEYGTNTFKYNRRRRIAFLEPVLRWAKKRKILLLIELKPDDIVSNAAGLINNAKTGKKVAKMLQKYRMHDQVIITSFSHYSTLSAKRAYPKLVVSTFMSHLVWAFPTQLFAMVKAQLIRTIPDLKQCLANQPADKRLADFLFTTGSIEKALSASITFLEIPLFNNPTYGGAANKNTKRMLKHNYGKGFLMGTGNFFNIEETKSKIKSLIPTYKYALKQGVKAIITDDLGKTKRLICKTKKYRCHCRYHRKKHGRHGIRHRGDVENQDQEIEALQRG